MGMAYTEAAGWQVTEDLIVTFARIGSDTAVPPLVVRGAPPDEVRQEIHRFVSHRLSGPGFTIQLWEEHGFIDVGTHSAGAFTLRPLSEEPGVLSEQTGVAGEGPK